MQRLSFVTAIALLILWQSNCLTLVDGKLINRCGIWQFFTKSSLVLLVEEKKPVVCYSGEKPFTDTKECLADIRKNYDYNRYNPVEAQSNTENQSRWKSGTAVQSGTAYPDGTYSSPKVYKCPTGYGGDTYYHQSTPCEIVTNNSTVITSTTTSTTSPITTITVVPSRGHATMSSSSITIPTYTMGITAATMDIGNFYGQNRSMQGRVIYCPGNNNICAYNER